MNPVSSKGYRFWSFFGLERGHLNVFLLRQGDLRATCPAATKMFRLEARELARVGAPAEALQLQEGQPLALGLRRLAPDAPQQLVAVREPSRVRHAAQFRAVARQLAAGTLRGNSQRTPLRHASIPAAVCPNSGLTASINRTARIIALPSVHATFHPRRPGRAV